MIFSILYEINISYMSFNIFRREAHTSTKTHFFSHIDILKYVYPWSIVQKWTNKSIHTSRNSMNLTAVFCISDETLFETCLCQIQDCKSLILQSCLDTIWFLMIFNILWTTTFKNLLTSVSLLIYRNNSTDDYNSSSNLKKKLILWRMISHYNKDPNTYWSILFLFPTFL